MKAINIKWDTDGDMELLEQLPTKMEIPEGIIDEEEISDYLTDEIGFCHEGFDLVNLETEENNMYLKDVLNLMCIEETGEEKRIITLKEHMGFKRIIYRGELKKLKDYVNNHEELKLEDGFYVYCKNVSCFTVVEIKIDHSNLLDEYIPDYNRSKIITIM